MPIVDLYRRALRTFRSSHARTTLLRTSAASLLLLALLTVGAVAQDTMGSPQPPTPRFFVVTDLGVDDVELTHVEPAEDGMTRITVYRPRVADMEIYDAGGTILGGDAFLTGVELGTAVLVAADENPVDPMYLSILRDDAFILVGVVVRVETQ